MTIAIFSDTHLTPEFNQPKCDFLIKLINSADLTIIAGDFIETDVTNWTELMQTSWRPLLEV